MGKIEKIIFEKAIEPMPAHNVNLLRVYRAPNGEVTIHYRNLKIVLHLPDIDEWRRGFAEALKKINEISSNK